MRILKVMPAFQYMVNTILKSIKQVRRLIVAAIGFTVLAIGIAMIVLPGPAFIVIPLGLFILGTEFLWAKRSLQKMKDKFKRK
jgi:uncharacterized membrane protein YbaN (DUF454 family)